MICFSCNKRAPQHFRPSIKPVMQAKPEECDLCGKVDWTVQYCGFCGHWLCQRCRDDPVRRFKGMLKEKVLKKKKLYD